MLKKRELHLRTSLHLRTRRRLRRSETALETEVPSRGFRGTQLSPPSSTTHIARGVCHVPWPGAPASRAAAPCPPRRPRRPRHACLLCRASHASHTPAMLATPRLPARCLPCLRLSATLCLRLRASQYSRRAISMACHLSPPTRGKPSQSSYTRPHAPQNSRFPNATTKVCARPSPQHGCPVCTARSAPSGRRVMLVEKMHRNIKPRGGNLQARASLLVATTLSRDAVKRVWLFWS